jgi:hypothetical protein
MLFDEKKQPVTSIFLRMPKLHHARAMIALGDTQAIGIDFECDKEKNIAA